MRSSQSHMISLKAIRMLFPLVHTLFPDGNFLGPVCQENFFWWKEILLSIYLKQFRLRFLLLYVFLGLLLFILFSWVGGIKAHALSSYCIYILLSLFMALWNLEHVYVFPICSLSSLHVSQWLYSCGLKWMLMFFMQIPIWVPCFMLFTSFLLMGSQSCLWQIKGLKYSTNKRHCIFIKLGLMRFLHVY